MRTILSILLALALSSGQGSACRYSSLVPETKQTHEPDYHLGVQFINDYLTYLRHAYAGVSLVQWVNGRTDVTPEFKQELQRIMDEALANDPEYGLGFDPLLDAQDYPSAFELVHTDSVFLVVKGTDWPEFQLTLKMELIGTAWLVDGSGVINVPEEKRIKR